MAPDLLECEAHGTPTRLRCAEAGCDKPICPQCLVKTSVGLKCQEHAQAIAPKFDRRAQRSVIGAVALVAIAVVILSVAVFNQSSKPTPAPDNTPAPAASGEANGPGRIVPASVYVINVDGSGARTLTNRALAFDAHPAWSPRGDRIAYASDRDGNPEIYVVGADGTGNRRLTDHPAGDSVPSWSPDGSRIAFVSDRDGQPGIWAMAADGSAPARLVAGPADPGSKPAWSPDGRTIAFASDRDGGNLEIFVADTAAGAGAPTKLIAGPGLDGEPAWSPDGAKLAFASDRDGSPQVYVANRDGSNVTKVTTKARSYTPAWAPDGRQLVYIYDPAPGG